jgi:GTPase SAR1 family protein
MSDSEEEIAERQFKIALVGDPEVGKTSIATRYAAGELGPLQPA